MDKRAINPRMDLGSAAALASAMNLIAPSTSAVPPIIPRSFGHALDTGAEVFGLLEESTGTLDDADELRRRMARDGYLFLPGLLDRGQVLAARHEVCHRLAQAGYLDPSAPPDDAIAAPGHDNGFMPEVVARDNAPLHSVLYDGAMMSFWRQFLGGDVRHFDYTWFRTIAPGPGTASHCDAVYMGRGTPRLYTAWTPVGDIDLEMGGLMILQGSNNHPRLLESYCKMDVDSYCVNRDGPAALDGWHKTNGWLGRDPNQIRRSLAGKWLTHPAYRAGDVLVFSIHTVHAGLDNQSAHRMRLSSDSRYQLASEPADPRWIGPNPVAHGPAGKRGRIC